MKRFLVILISAFTFISCNEEIKDYVSLSGQLDGMKVNDTVINVNSRKYSKTLKIDSEGNFKDTLHIKEADFYSISLDRITRFTTYLNIGDDLTITGDVKDLNNTLIFKGRGEETNNYMVTRIKNVKVFSEELKSLYALDSTEFTTKIDDFSKKMSALLANKKIDTAVVSREEQGLEGYVTGIKSRYKKQHALQISFAKGKASPKFVDLENFKGGTTSLDDLKGKFVYVDVWATWCKPCLAQIPALKELEEEYIEKNIEFVSISTDKAEKYEAWQNMIRAKEMSGIQLYAGKSQSFMQEYQIANIPRFIFIDTEGNIVNANAPRPTEKEKIKKMFEEAGL